MRSVEPVTAVRLSILEQLECFLAERLPAFGPYQDADTGADACPFNALYWAFLDHNEDRLRSNHRMALMYR
ncbi:MAG: deoxyribodipyrimidine photolyase-like uncharacterized protein, partial [Haloarculaceae archaeon]